MLHFALIGVGAWGKNYLSTMKSFRDCRIKYLCASSTKTLASISGDYIKTTDYRELFSYPDINGVIIATPNSTHDELSYEFLKRGINVLIEKPLSENYLQARKLQPIMQKSGSKLIVGHTYLFDPAYIKAKELVKEIGPIRYLSYEGTNNGPYREGTSTLWDVGPHAVSLCLDIHSKQPIKVAAWEVDTLRPGKSWYDFAFIKITFSDQTEAFIKISWLFPVKKRELLIVGSRDGLVYDAVVDKRVMYYKNMIPNKQEIKLRKTTTEIVYPKYEAVTPLENEIKEFIEAIGNKNNNKKSGLDLGIAVTKIINSAEESIKLKGKSISL
jgi:predicted dehydrogenase